MSEARKLRQALRSVGNTLSVEGHEVSGSLMLKLAAFSDDHCLNELVKQLKEMAKVND